MHRDKMFMDVCNGRNVLIICEHEGMARRVKTDFELFKASRYISSCAIIMLLSELSRELIFDDQSIRSSVVVAVSESLSLHDLALTVKDKDTREGITLFNSFTRKSIYTRSTGETVQDANYTLVYEE